MKFFLISIFFIGLFSFGQNQQEISKGLKLLEKYEIFYQKSEYDSAYNYAKKSFKLFNQIKVDSFKIISMLKIIALTDSINEQNIYFEQLKEIAQKEKNNNLLAAVFYAKGKNFYFHKEFGKSLPYYLIVDSISKKFNFIDKAVIKAILDRSEISRITFTHDGVELAHDLQKEALKLAKEINSEELIHNIYLRLADMNGLLGNYQETKKFTDLAFLYFKKNDNVKQLVRVYYTYMNYYYGIEDYNMGGKKLQEGIEYFKTKNNHQELASLLVAHGNFFRKRKNDCKNAIIEFEKAKILYDKMGLKLSDRYMYLVEGLALCNAELKDYKKAYIYYQETYEIKKKLIKNVNNDLSRKLEAKYQAQKKEQEIVLLKSKSKLIEQQKTNQRNLLLSGIGLTSLAGLFFFFQYRNRQKITKKLQELDRAKSIFFANISHEFRTPLTLISGPIQSQLKKDNLSNEERKSFEMMKQNSNRLISLVDQLLDISKIESGKFTLQVSNNEVLHFVGTIVESFDFLAKQKQINFMVNIEGTKSSNNWFDKSALEKIIINLLSNAIKYTPEKGSIICSAYVENDKLYFEIKNTGKGLSNEEVKKVFERFYQINSNKKGVGIGLALVKDLVKIHKGSISVESIIDKWTTFSLVIPISKLNFEESEISTKAIEKKYRTIKSKTIPIKAKNDDTLNENDESPILLVVEDNDDVRAYISSIFNDEYHIKQAKDGEEGIIMAIEQIPDIIISDIMMPNKNGIELCNTLKVDERTSHIPIILLTAKAGEENKIEGIKTGADDYITKPFNEDLLVLKVAKLLENRKKLQDRYSQEIILKPSDIAISSTDEIFLERVQTVLDKNLIEPSFSIEEFSSAVGMSRMQLHRKLKALTGLSASKFINTQRLKLAAQLLKESDVNVSQIGYSVGFNDHAYFSKCFKKLFNCTPSEYANKK